MFGKLKESSLLFYANALQNDVKALSKYVRVGCVCVWGGCFNQKAHFFTFEPYDLVQIWPARGPNTYKTMCGEILRLPVSAFATVVRSIFNVKFAKKKIRIKQCAERF